ncbi:unnamed protein product [Moneuplotes crassus]|uniref:Uncharacterized protein n=1 Tax=Euplotes crassus TaxID=5936 RepID=A0AAD1U7A3_EUPCR|nr:unnamed protein product [Moneuplotes crassus]
MFSTKVIKPKIITKIANHSFYNQKSNKQKSRRQTPKLCLFDLSLAMPSKRVPTAPKFGQITLKRFRNKTIQIAKEPKKASPQRPFILSSRKTSQCKQVNNSRKKTPTPTVKLNVSIPHASKISPKPTKELNQVLTQLYKKVPNLTFPHPNCTQNSDVETSKCQDEAGLSLERYPDSLTNNPKTFSSFISFIRTKMNEPSWVYKNKSAFSKRRTGARTPFKMRNSFGLKHRAPSVLGRGRCKGRKVRKNDRVTNDEGLRT